MSRPFLSVVVATRNDQHGGDPNARLRLAIEHFRYWADRAGLSAEYLVVDWNPPAQKANMAEVIQRWNLPASRVRVRILEVPRQYHQALGGPEALEFYQMIAKNVGIRRAAGEYILASNIDILFSPAILRVLTRQNLSPGRMYRSDRLDLSADCLGQKAENLEDSAMMTKLTRYNRRTGTLPIGRLGNQILGNLASRPPPWRKRFWEKIHLWLRRHNLPDPIRSRYPLHTNGCGDFTLLHRQAWQQLRGYLELPVFSFHLDSIFCCQAHQSGFEEKVLAFPLVHFHLDHGGGWSPEASEHLFARLREKNIPFLDSEAHDFEKLCLRGRTPLVFNKENWGFGGETFPEKVIL